MGGGILPVSLQNGHLYFLLGKERGSNEWSDFGGSKEKGEIPFQTAMREGTEELSGFFGSQHHLEKEVKENMVAKLEAQNKTYTSFVFLTNYDPNLPKYFNNNFRFMKKMAPEVVKSKNGLFEKSEIKWVRQDRLNNSGMRYRQFFYNGIVTQIKKIKI